MPPMKIAAAPLLLLLAAHAPAPAQDPLQSAACAAALAQLQAARGGDAPAATVDGLRSTAAAACLGTSTVPARPGRIAQQPIAVPPPLIEAPARVAPLPAARPPPPVAIERAPLPAHCDAGGCWTHDGSHLRHVPPTLAGPGGLCTPAGAVVYCP